jgi:hypothetical protein
MEYIIESESDLLDFIVEQDIDEESQELESIEHLERIYFE